MGVYEVVGRRAYRGHEPGVVFEAALQPGPERRAVDRGDIVLLERIVPCIETGRLVLPVGWGNDNEGSR
jgi:hypothetical protein